MVSGTLSLTIVLLLQAFDDDLGRELAARLALHIEALAQQGTIQASVLRHPSSSHTAGWAGEEVPPHSRATTPATSQHHTTAR
jgi:hypothetical protein